MQAMNKHSFKQLLFCFLLLTIICSPINIFGQQQGTIHGTVLDINGQSVIGANILIKGTSQGTVTDIDGHYTLMNVEPSSTLVFSYIGYIDQ